MLESLSFDNQPNPSQAVTTSQITRRYLVEVAAAVHGCTGGPLHYLGSPSLHKDSSSSAAGGTDISDSTIFYVSFFFLSPEVGHGQSTRFARITAVLHSQPNPSTGANTGHQVPRQAAAAVHVCTISTHALLSAGSGCFFPIPYL